MSRPTRRAKDSVQEPSPPVPPSDGWTLMEAVGALCPHEAELYRQGGAPLKAAMLGDGDPNNPWAEFLPYPSRGDEWLSECLLFALCERPDLQLTGHNLAKGADAERFRLPYYFLLAAVKGDEKDFSMKFRPLIYLSLRRGTARIWCELVGNDGPEIPVTQPESVELIAVWIEATNNVSAKVAPPEMVAGATGKQKYSPDRCRSWLKSRVEDWPKGKPPPSSADCLAAARAHFAGHIPRDAFRASAARSCLRSGKSLARAFRGISCRNRQQSRSKPPFLGGLIRRTAAFSHY